jgi:hypothetical protein
VADRATSDAAPRDTDEHDAHDHDHDEWELTPEQSARVTAALANLDDASLKRGLTTMREQTRQELAQYLNLSKATMALGDSLVPLVRRKVLAATAERQFASAFALAHHTNEDTIAALGERSDDPSLDEMREVLPGVIERQGLGMTTLMLAAYAASDAKCQAVFAELLDTDERFALPEPPPREAEPEIEGPGIVTFTRDADDPTQAAKRAQRKEAKAAKRAAAAARRVAGEAAQSSRKTAQHQAKQQRARRH